jgi:hypothetical protein
MTERKGDDSKRIPGCTKDNENRCPYMEETGGGFAGEQYHCDKCGAAYYLDYDDMK